MNFLKKKTILLLCLLLTLVIVFTGCSSNNENSKSETNEQVTSSEEKKEEEKTVIKVGTDAFQRPAVDACADALAEMGYELEVVVFDDNVMPNTAIMEGTIDANMYQHRPFMETFNETKDGKLVMMDPVLYYTTIGLYSEKYDNVEDLPEKASIVVGSDASNIDRALRMLDSQNLITLGDKEGEFYNIHDIKENPKNFEFKEVAGRQVVNNMQDVDAAVLYGTTLLQAGKDPSTALFFDDKTRDKTYAIGVTVHEDNKDSQWAKDLVNAFMTETTWKNVDAHFKGSYAKAYDD